MSKKSAGFLAGAIFGAAAGAAAGLFLAPRPGEETRAMAADAVMTHGIPHLIPMSALLAW